METQAVRETLSGFISRVASPVYYRCGAEVGTPAALAAADEMYFPNDVLEAL